MMSRDAEGADGAGPGEQGAGDRTGTGERTDGGVSTAEVRDRTASRVFERISSETATAEGEVLDRYGVESPAEVVATAEDPPPGEPLRQDPLVIGAEPFDPEVVLLDGRHEGEVFNWVAADGTTAGGATGGVVDGGDATDGTADAPDAVDHADADTADAGDTATPDPPRVPGPLGRLLRRIAALF